MRYLRKALSSPSHSDFLGTLQRTLANQTFILKAPPGSPAARSTAASLMLARKAHEYFWRTERIPAAAHNTFSSPPPPRRFTFASAGKMRAVNYRLDGGRRAVRPLHRPGRVAGVRAEPLCSRGTSRMALFASKRFDPRLSSRFPKFKGQYALFFSVSRRKIMSTQGHVFQPPTFVSPHEEALGEIPGRLDVWNEVFEFSSSSFHERKTHTPFDSKLCKGGFYVTFFPPRSPCSSRISTSTPPCDTGLCYGLVSVKTRGVKTRYFRSFTRPGLCVCTRAARMQPLQWNPGLAIEALMDLLRRRSTMLPRYETQIARKRMRY